MEYGPGIRLPSLGARRRLPIQSERQLAVVEMEDEHVFLQAPPAPAPTTSRFRSQERNYQSENHKRNSSRSIVTKRKNRRPEDRDNLSQETLAKLKTELDELSRYMKQETAEDDPVAAYARRLADPTSIKIYSPEAYGYKIISKTRSANEQREVDKSNYEILKFVYMEPTSTNLESNPLDTHVIENIQDLVKNYSATEFRSGAFSATINYDYFPPSLTWRNRDCNNQMNYLRPVVVDGVAVMYVATNEHFRPFLQSSVPTECIPYSNDLILQVKPLFDILVSFLIRGHKTCIYLPKYYRQFVTKGRFSKVDDVAAFQKLIDLDLIHFLEPKMVQHSRKWFNAVAEVADSQKAIFISSMDYRPRGPCAFQKQSERIITPCFLNTEDRLMVISTVFRYRVPNSTKYGMIPSSEILTFEPQLELKDRDRDEGQNARLSAILSSQLYLQDQIRLICELCQLYPMKSLNVVSIKQLLLLVVCADALLPMPNMTRVDFQRLEHLHLSGDLN